MAKNTASRTQEAKPLMERAEIMAVARGAKKIGNTKCETNILQNRKVGEVGMKIVPRDTSERTCFTCANSFVDDADKLHCMADNHNHEKTVEDDQTCDDWN